MTGIKELYCPIWRKKRESEIKRVFRNWEEEEKKQEN